MNLDNVYRITVYQDDEGMKSIPIDCSVVFGNFAVVEIDLQLVLISSRRKPFAQNLFCNFLQFSQIFAAVRAEAEAREMVMGFKDVQCFGKYDSLPLI